jgi:hypothetical protein
MMIVRSLPMLAWRSAKKEEEKWQGAETAARAER